MILCKMVNSKSVEKEEESGESSGGRERIYTIPPPSSFSDTFNYEHPQTELKMRHPCR